MSAGSLVAAWDAEYRAGRYAGDPPLPFVRTILATLDEDRRAREGTGLYVGCGNGRNFLPLVEAGLNLIGLDVSRAALAQLAGRAPARVRRLVCADFRDLATRTAFDYIIAIQSFQHGGEADAAAYFDRAASALRPGGLLFLRTNSAATEVYHRHTVVERHPLGGFTVRYEDGPKRGLRVHFYSRAELLARTREQFVPVIEPREDVIRRDPPKTGSWAQWEGVWRRGRLRA